MLLLMLGASDDDIVADYAETGANMQGVMTRSRAVLGPSMKQLGFDFSKMQRSALTGGGMDLSMQMMLAHLRATYGDPLTPLRVEGLSDDTIAQLRRRALAASGARTS